MQQLSYDLCYAYGRATLSVSIPAPVYCEYSCSPSKEDLLTNSRLQMPTSVQRAFTRVPADDRLLQLVCRREKFMFSPDFLRKLGSDSGSVIAGGESEQQLMQEYQSEFGPMHEFHADKMFFL